MDLNRQTSINIAIIITALAFLGAGFMFYYRSSSSSFRSIDPKEQISNRPITQPIAGETKAGWLKAKNLPGNLSFNYPTFGYSGGNIVPGHPTSDSNGIWTVYDANFATPDRASWVTLYHITLLPNVKYRSISDWFANNIDQQGVLAEAHTFELRQLPNGFQALVLTEKIPASFANENGPIDGIFAMSPTTKSVVIIGGSDAGYLKVPYQEQQAAFLELLTTMQAP